MPTKLCLLLRFPSTGHRYLEYLDQTKSRGKKSASKAPTSQLAPSSSTGSFTSDLTRSESLEAALAEVSGSNSLRRRRTQMQQQTREPYSSTSSSPRWSTLHKRGEAGFWGGFDSSREAGGSGSSLFDFLLPGGDEDDEVSLFCPRASARARKGYVIYVVIAHLLVDKETAW
jgi:hypothetical protein